MMKAIKEHQDQINAGQAGKGARVEENMARRIALSVPEFARAMGLGLTTINKLIREEKIHSIKVLGRRLIPASECVDFIQRMSGN